MKGFDVIVRVKKEYRSVSFKLDLGICDRLDAYSEETGVPKTKVVERALAMYLDKDSENLKQRAAEQEN